MKLSVLVFALSFLSQAYAADLTLVKVKQIGPMNQKVIFQSSKVKQINKSNIVKGSIIAQWGTQVFEVLDGYYKCNTKNVCKLVESERVATYSSCVIKKQKAVCTNKISGLDEVSTSSDVTLYDSPDSVNDSLGRDRYYDENAEFPARIQDEFSDIF